VAKVRSRGSCQYCQREIARSGMARHLAACETRRNIVAEINAAPGQEARLFHLQVKDAWSGEYWLNLEVDGSASMGVLDSYLRAIWLECCGHASQFSIGGWRGQTVAMTRKVHQVFRTDVEVTHIYDFGTESVTLIAAVDQRTGKPTTRRPIALMARNLAPVVECQECGSIAVYFCEECRIEHDQPGALCAEHGVSHPHEDYGELMSIVNSPRSGMCGYTGPAEPPY
jgi:hypothetical protein